MSLTYSQLPSSYKNTFRAYTNLLRCIGLDFFVDEKGFNRYHVRFVIFVVFFLPFVVTQFALIGEINTENFLESVRVVPVDFMFFMDFIKISISFMKRDQLRRIFFEIGELWPIEAEESEEKRKIMKRLVRRYVKLPADISLKFGTVNSLIFEAIPIAITTISLFKGDVVYLFPFKPTKIWRIDSYFVYVLTYILQLFGSFPSHVCLYMPFDLMIVVLTANVSVLLMLLQEDLKSSVKWFNEENKLRKDIHLSDDESFKEVKRIAIVHQKLLSLAAQLSDVFGIVIFFHVALASLLICFFGFLTVVYGGLAETFANLVTMMGAMLTIFLLSLAGQFLCDASIEVADAAYQSFWYQSDVRVKNLLFFIMIRAQQPSYLSALGFMDLTLRSFSKIMSSAWTYFSVLIQMYGDN